MTSPLHENQLPVTSTLPKRLLPRRLLSIELVVVDERLGILGGGRWFGTGRNPVHGAEHHEFGIALLDALTLEKITQDRNVAQARNFVPNVGDTIIDQTGDHEALSVAQLELGLSLARAQSRDSEARNSQSVGKIESADFGGDDEVNIAVGHDHRGELEPDAKLLEGDGNGGESLSRLHNGEGKLAAGEEAGFLAVDGDEVGLGQDLEKVLGLERLDHGAQVNIGLKQKQIKNVAEGLSGRERRTLSLGLGDAWRGEAAVLAGGCGSEQVAGAGRKNVGAELGKCGSVNLGKLDFEQDFLSAHGTESEHIDHVLRIGGSQLSSALG